MIFLKGILGGIFGMALAWAALLTAFMVRLSSAARRSGARGTFAVAGGWDYLIQLPLTILLLSASFGAGVYLATRWAARQ